MITEDPFKQIISKISKNKKISKTEADMAFSLIINGSATDAQIGAFLMGLSLTGETSDIIASGASMLRQSAIKIKSDDKTIDTVGTGGDGAHTLNISSAAAFVVAGADIKVAKHGNRSLSSKSGAADVLSELGINLDCPFEIVQEALNSIGICFLMAPRHLVAMKHVGPARVQLGIRTIFNLLGPLSNPAFVKRQLVGVFDKKWLHPFAEALNKMGSSHAWIIHGRDGLDEVSISDKTDVVQLINGVIKDLVIEPEEYGYKKVKLGSIRGGDPKYNALELRSLLEGKEGPYKDIVLLNSAAAIAGSGHENDFGEALNRSKISLESGKALKKLEALISITNNK
jgi:anthranilate phosphoribosyltransferase